MVERFFNLPSLRSRLVLLVALAILPTAVMILVNAWQEHANSLRAAEENLLRVTTLAAANKAKSLENARQILQDLSSVPDIFSDTEKCNQLLKNVLKKSKSDGYLNFGVIQLDGAVTCSAVPSEQPVNLADRLHFKRAIAERRFIVSNYVFGRVIQRHTINLTYPVIDVNNQVVAVVFAAMDLTELDRFISEIDLPNGSILITADGEGSIISRRPVPEQWFGKKVSSEMLAAMKQQSSHAAVIIGPDNIMRMHTFARVGTPELTDYTLTIGIPHEAILSEAHHRQFIALSTIALTIMLALVAAWFIGDILVVRRVRCLVHTASLITSGSLEARTGIQYGNEEISNLARALDTMADVLQRRQAEQQQAESTLRDADKRKDEFLAMLAHELRNPLAPIISSAQLLKLMHAEMPRVVQMSDIIARQVEHMTGLIDDLLDVSRVTRGIIVLNFEALDMRQVIAEAVEQTQPLIHGRHHDLRLKLPQTPVEVRGDRKRLVQTVSNLLNNSAKYTPEGGIIELSLQALPQEVEMRVSDNGIGMTSEFLGEVFELFAQAERTSDRSQGGLGLGLALVKSLVGLHGGTVQAHSPGPDLGSSFTVRLPRIFTERKTIESVAKENILVREYRPLRIMIVDDNADAACTLALFFKDTGHEVTVANNAQEAIALACHHVPHVFLLDIGLPDMDGKQLAKHLRSMPECADAVLIAITGYGQAHDRRSAIAAGFDHYFVKPVHIEQLSAALGQNIMSKDCSINAAKAS